VQDLKVVYKVKINYRQLLLPTVVQAYILFLWPSFSQLRMFWSWSAGWLRVTNSFTVVPSTNWRELDAWFIICHSCVLRALCHTAAVVFLRLLIGWCWWWQKLS